MLSDNSALNAKVQCVVILLLQKFSVVQMKRLQEETSLTSALSAFLYEQSFKFVATGTVEFAY